MNAIPVSGLRSEKDEPRAADTANHELFELQLRIARRADELAKTALLLRDHSLECWLRAERELLTEGLWPGATSLLAPKDSAGCN